jgi:hypothetical protein
MGLIVGTNGVNVIAHGDWYMPTHTRLDTPISDTVPTLLTVRVVGGRTAQVFLNGVYGPNIPGASYQEVAPSRNVLPPNSWGYWTTDTFGTRWVGRIGTVFQIFRTVSDSEMATLGNLNDPAMSGFWPILAAFGWSPTAPQLGQAIQLTDATEFDPGCMGGL